MTPSVSAYDSFTASTLRENGVTPMTAMYGGRHVVVGHVSKEATRYLSFTSGLPL